MRNVKKKDFYDEKLSFLFALMLLLKANILKNNLNSSENNCMRDE